MSYLKYLLLECVRISICILQSKYSQGSLVQTRTVSQFTKDTRFGQGTFGAFSKNLYDYFKM